MPPSALRLISASKWPEFAMIAPDFIVSKDGTSMTFTSPVTVMKTSPMGAASAIGMTRKPSMTASSARSGSISVTMTWAPMPRARIATPLPHHP